MSRLIAFGCSHTYGVGLPDCYKLGKTLGTPSKLSWPQLVANELNYECVNLSEPGSSNKRITYNVSKFNFLSTDLVMILWTYPARHCIIKDNHIVDILPLTKGKLEKTYYKNFHTEKDNKFMDNVYKTFAHSYLSTVVQCSKHFSVVFDASELDFIEGIYFDNYNSFGKALDGCHHHEKDQKKFALDMLRIIDES